MRLLRRPSRREREEALTEALLGRCAEALRTGRPDHASVYERFFMYASIGKDRRKLGMEFVDMADEQVAHLDRFRRALGADDVRPTGPLHTH